MYCIYYLLHFFKTLITQWSYLIHTVLCVQSTPRRLCESSETEHFAVLRSYSMNQVRQNMCRAIKKNGYSTTWTRKVAVLSLIATQNRKWSYWHYSCIEFLVLKLMFMEISLPFKLSAILFDHVTSTPTTPPQKVVYSEQLLHSCSLILDWNSACPE